MEEHTGIIRHMSVNGQLVIPRKVRAQQGWDTNTPILIRTIGEYVLLCTAPTAGEDKLRELKALYESMPPAKQEALLALARCYAQETEK